MFNNIWGGPVTGAVDAVHLRMDRRMEEYDDLPRTEEDDLQDSASARSSLQLDRQPLGDSEKGWMLRPPIELETGNAILEYLRSFFKAWRFLLLAILVALIIFLSVWFTRKHPDMPPTDNYKLALNKALMFFNAQKSGNLPRGNNVTFRGNSGLRDGMPGVDLVGGYYDAGDNIKFLFPQAYAMTLLSWSVIEYKEKYAAAGELDHVRELIKWGTDYMLKTFNSTGMERYNETTTNVDKIYAQVGAGDKAGPKGNASGSPNDHSCWERPEDMDYPRPVAAVTTGSDLAAEMAASLAAASIVFKSEPLYSQILVNSARALFKMSRKRRGRYNVGTRDASQFYNSSGYYDEFLWGGAWLYYATGETQYLDLVTNYDLGKRAGAYSGGPYYGVLDWNNKLAGAQVLLTRFRLIKRPGYPYEEVLLNFHNQTEDVMCSYLPQYNGFPRTPGGLIILNQGDPAPLQYTVNAAFLVTLYSDYLIAADVPGLYCGSDFYTADALRSFARTQINYILGDNPQNMSYVVGYGNKYPRHLYHRAASVPKDTRRYGCQEGWKFRDSKQPDPNVLVGAMVGGPDTRDNFQDARNYNFTEPTIAGNAGLVGALVALSGRVPALGKDIGVDAMAIFSSIPGLAPPPPSPPFMMPSPPPSPKAPSPKAAPSKAPPAAPSPKAAASKAPPKAAPSKASPVAPSPKAAPSKPGKESKPPPSGPETSQRHEP